MYWWNSEVKQRGVQDVCVILICWQETQEYTKTVARYCLETLQIWFDAIGFVDEVQCFMVVGIHSVMFFSICAQVLILSLSLSPLLSISLLPIK